MKLSLSLIIFFGTFYFMFSSFNLEEISCNSEYGSTKYSGICLPVDDCAGAALIGNCSNAVCCIKDIINTNNYPNSTIKKELFLKLVGNTPRNNFLYNYFAESLELSQINTPYRAAAYLATLVSESNYFRELESKIDDADINSELGNNQTGDGKLYRGRGTIFLRGKSNYILANSKLNTSYDLVKNPERAAFPSIAFKVGSFIWSENSYIINSDQPAKKGNLNDLVDGTFLNFTLLTHPLTNDLSKLKERANFNDLVLKELEYAPLKRGNGIQCKFNNEYGVAVPICLEDFKRPYCGCENEYDRRSCPYGLSGNKCRSSSIVKCCVENKKTNYMDLAFLIDASGSIGEDNFLKIQKFVIQILENFDIGANETKIGLLYFTNAIKEIVNFKNFKNFTNIKNEILNLNYSAFSSFGTNTAGALEHANVRIFEEDLGMRPEEFGIPKTIIVITDGDSDNKKETSNNATVLKKKGFNIITVGIGNLFTDEKELLDIASSKNDAFKIDEYERLTFYLSTLARSTNQKQAMVSQEKQINSFISENSYKYFKYKIENPLFRTVENKTFLTIKLEYTGLVELFYDFVDPNPKSDVEFLNQNDLDTLNNYIKMNDNTNLNQNSNTSQKMDFVKYYMIEMPVDKTNEFLSISVKGLNQYNEFKLTIFDRLIDGVNSTDSPTISTTKSTIISTLTSASKSSTSQVSNLTNEPTRASVTTSIFETTTSYIFNFLTTKKSSSASKTSSFYLILTSLLCHFFLKK